jgi:ribosomal protein S18 acetylase RimI-like enzyme
MELYAIYLLQEFQRKGLGRELWTSMVASIQNTGATAVTVWVLVANTPAQNFYKALGFRPDGEVKTIDVGEVNLREMRYRLPLMQSAQA